MFRQVLVPVEFSEGGRLAARHACDVVRAIGGTVTLLHVLEHAKPSRGGSVETPSQDSQFEDAHVLLRQFGLYARRPPAFLIVPAFHGVASAILDVAAETDAELIMMGLHRQDGPGTRTLGRVVLQVLLGAGVPV